MKKLLLILLTLTLTFAGCNLRENTIKNQETQTKQTEPELQKVIKEDNTDKQKTLNDNLVKNLLERYPSALITDSIQDSYTIYLQDLLIKSSNLLFFNDASIKDIEGTNRGYYLITIYSYFPKIIGQFKIHEPLLSRLLKELKPEDIYESGCFVVNVRDLIPVKTHLALNINEFYNTGESNRVSEDDIRNNVDIALTSDSFPMYLINGELIDYFILK